MRRPFFLLPALLLVLAVPAGAVTGTLTLDVLSHISFGDKQLFLLPAGSTMEFDFGASETDGTLPFTIQPSGVSIPPLALGEGRGTLHYSLAAPASGTMSPTTGGRSVSFTAAIQVTRKSAQGQDAGTFVYSIPFTTEFVEATSLSGDIHVEELGMRLVEGAWYLQLVGATVNKENAFPEPGTAVYTVLSGTFDSIP